MPKIKKCKKCNNNLYRNYIRLNETKKKKLIRTWIGIGYYCLKCEILYKENEV